MAWRRALRLPLARLLSVVALWVSSALLVPAWALDISGTGSHADWPSAGFGPDGDLWVAWIEYDGNGTDRVHLRRRAGSDWQPTMVASPAPGDYLETALAVQPDGRVWVAWAAQIDGNFDLYARSWREGEWTSVERLTADPQPDMHHRLLADSQGRLFLVWQSFRTGDANIYLKVFDKDRWSGAVPLTSHEANEWRPDAALDSQGRLFVAYDTYRHGDYDIYLRIYHDGTLSPEHPIADTPRFEARATVAVDSQGRAWVAWDDQGPGWGLDQPNWTRQAKRGDWGPEPPWSVEGSVGRMVSLRYTQAIGVAVFAGGRRWEPRGRLADSMTPEFALSYEIPQLAIDADGLPRLFMRRWVPIDDGGGMKERPGAWNIHWMAYRGDGWTAPERLADSAGSNDQRLSVATASDGRMWIAFPSDDRWKPGSPVVPHDDRSLGRVRVAPVAPVASVPAQLSLTEEPDSRRPYKRTAWSDRRQSIAAGQRRYQLYWGDLHRHTEISGDGGFDGTLWDMYRYALDAADLDFIASTDHYYGDSGMQGRPENRGYDWWRTQKLADAFHVRGRLAPLFGYERSLRWPYGHRNIIEPDRGSTAVNRTMDRGRENEDSPREPEEPRLWEHLRDRQALSIPHTIAAGGGTNFAFNDPALEPLLEIYQGCRMSYEASGAPRVNSAERFAAGFAQSALAKGYKIGFIASSDHRSTHISYAAVYAEELTREGIFRALRQRHAYAATDNIVVDVRVGDAIMGDATTAREPPTVRVTVRGTGPLHSVEIIKDNAHLYSLAPGTRDVSFAYRDRDAEPGESYYYVRVQQEDGQMAWASPIWVDFEPE